MQIGNFGGGGSKDTHWTGLYMIIAALIGAAALIYVSLPKQPEVPVAAPPDAAAKGEGPIVAAPLFEIDPGTHPDPKSADNSEAIVFADIQMTPQKVNQKFLGDRATPTFATGTTDRATFTFRVRNQLDSEVRISKAVVVVDEASAWHDLGGTTGLPSRISHSGHIEADVGFPNVGDEITIPLSIQVASRSPREFTFWFRCHDHRVSVLQIIGNLRLYGEDGNLLGETEKPLDIEVHPEVSMFKPLVPDI